MSWLILTVIAQFLNSIVALFDKYLVTSKRVTTPLLYVFYTGILSIVGVLIYVPSFVLHTNILPKFSSIELLTFSSFLLLSFSVLSQLVALWGLFASLKKNDASDVVPVIGSFAAIFALIISFVFSNTILPAHFTLGFTLLVLGTLFISHLRFNRKTLFFSLLSGVGFALHGILLKEALTTIQFDTGFFWFTIFMTIYSMPILLFSSVRQAFKSQKKEKHIKTTGLLLLINKIIAGIAGILLIKAIEIGEVSLVQALGGLQFLFLFLLAIILGPYTDVDFGENHQRKDVYQKLTAVSIIFIGFVLLFR
jgi:uncharacterized membrane protein